MEHIEVESSKIASVGYDVGREQLQVAMKNGDLLQFSQVPHRFWRELMVADSIGRYFYDNIKDTFPVERGKWKDFMNE